MYYVTKMDEEPTGQCLNLPFIDLKFKPLLYPVFQMLEGDAIQTALVRCQDCKEADVIFPFTSWESTTVMISGQIFNISQT